MCAYVCAMARVLSRQDVTHSQANVVHDKMAVQPFSGYNLSHVDDCLRTHSRRVRPARIDRRFGVQTKHVDAMRRCLYIGANIHMHACSLVGSMPPTPLSLPCRNPGMEFFCFSFSFCSYRSLSLHVSCFSTDS